MKTRAIPPLVGHTAWAKLPDEHRPDGLMEYTEVVIVALNGEDQATVQTKSGRRCRVNLTDLDCGFELMDVNGN